MPLSFKLIRNLGLFIFVLIIGIIGAISIINTAKIMGSLSDVVKAKRPLLDKVDSIREDFLTARDIFISFLREEGKEQVNEVMALMDEVIRKSTLLEKTVEKKDKDEVDKFIKAAKRFKTAANAYVQEYETDPTGSSAITMGQLAIAIAKETSDALGKMVNDIGASIRASDINALIIAKKSQNLVLAGIFIGALVGLLVSFLMNQALIKPLNQLSEATRHIGQGDLAYRINLNTKDEIGQFASSFDKMTEELEKSTIELQETQSYLNNIMESMIDMLIVLNLDGTIRVVNRATCQYLGYKREELIGKDATILCPEEKGMLFGKAARERLIQEGCLKENEMTFKTKEGKEISVSFSVSVMRGPQGHAANIVYVAKDITERRKAEEEQKRLMKDLAETNKIMVGRELRMIELKREINKLSEELGRSIPYDMSENPVHLNKPRQY